MRVIFLDVDGVLNSERFNRTLEDQHRQLGHHDVCECFKLTRQVDRAAVGRLNRLIAATGAKIVVSSSWRKLLDPEELRRVLVEHGLVGDIVGETPDAQDEDDEAAILDVHAVLDRITRGHEIDFWLRQHPEVDRFVILDDSADMAMHKNRHVQTDAEEGLLDEHVDLALRTMMWDGKSIPSPNGIEDKRPGSSAGIHCHAEGCVETLQLQRTTSIAPSHDEDYQHLMPALDEAAVFLGWRVWHSVFWCPRHVVAKQLACASCRLPCPRCACAGGPYLTASEGSVAS